MDPETTGAATARDNPLGRFLRARRERLSPEDAGIPYGTRRRVAGLRREEVAATSLDFSNIHAND